MTGSRSRSYEIECLCLVVIPLFDCTIENTLLVADLVSVPNAERVLWQVELVSRGLGVRTHELFMPKEMWTMVM